MSGRASIASGVWGKQRTKAEQTQSGGFDKSAVSSGGLLPKCTLYSTYEVEMAIDKTLSEGSWFFTGANFNLQATPYQYPILAGSVKSIPEYHPLYLVPNFRIVPNPAYVNSTSINNDQS